MKKSTELIHRLKTFIIPIKINHPYTKEVLQDYISEIRKDKRSYVMCVDDDKQYKVSLVGFVSSFTAHSRELKGTDKLVWIKRDGMLFNKYKEEGDVSGSM